MSLFHGLQVILYFAALRARVEPLGAYMARFSQGERIHFDPILCPIERLIDRVSGIRADVEMGWKTFALAVALSYT